MTRRSSSTWGFSRAASLMQPRIAKASEGRGFAVSRLLTHWAEIVGEDVAAMAEPVKVGYGRGGLGATLTLLCAGANAPLLEMQREQIRERVNACYGYNAIARVRLTQSTGAGAGFAEARRPFTQAASAAPKAAPAITPAARDSVAGVANDDLRQALETLAAHVLQDTRTNRRPS